MAKFYDSITPELRTFIAAQHIFFTASAAASGRVNLSPKGMDTLRVLDERTVAYLDATGSGNETAAHLKADGRLTIMLCSFDAAPAILRLYGRGRLVFPRDPAWVELRPLWGDLPGERQIVVLDVESLQTSCGFGVARYEFKGERLALRDWAEAKGEEALTAYRRKHNRLSIDGFASETTDTES
jgi:hypothetical protein